MKKQRIIDKIQTDSQCCGITNSLDYKRSIWRRIKLIQLAERLNWTTSLSWSQLRGNGNSNYNNNNNNNNNNINNNNNDSINDDAYYSTTTPTDSKLSDDLSSRIASNLLSRVPLVPASCCRTTFSSAGNNIWKQQQQQHNGADTSKRQNVIFLDDSQLEKPARVPAWSPSMVVENLAESQDRERIKMAEDNSIGPPNPDTLTDDDNDDNNDDNDGQQFKDNLRQSKRPASIGHDETRMSRANARKAAKWKQRQQMESARRRSESDNGLHDDNERLNVVGEVHDKRRLNGQKFSEAATITSSGQSNVDSDSSSSGTSSVSGPNFDNSYDNLSSQQRRLLAKQDNFNYPVAKSEPSSDSFASETRRRRSSSSSSSSNDGIREEDAKEDAIWSVESMVDESQRVLSRLIGADAVQTRDDDDDDNRTIKPNAHSTPKYVGLSTDQATVAQRGTTTTTTARRSAKCSHQQCAHVNDGRRRSRRVDGVKEISTRTKVGSTSANHDESESNSSGALNETFGHSNADKLAALRRLLFNGQARLEDETRNSNDVEDYESNLDKDSDDYYYDDNQKDDYDEARGKINDNDRTFGRDNFKWPNKLKLSYEQYQLLESYLLSAEDVGGSKEDENGGETELENESSSTLRERRAIIDKLESNEGGETNSKLSKARMANILESVGQNERNELTRKLRSQLVDALRWDPDTSCAPRSYYDRATIYTHGCQPSIKSWLDSSAHMLFVTGFCVLTVLKFCSVVLLRLEIQEMIHKIRVLKGMATEYNALHDLEAYLPRSSVCAQAAELTLSGVAPAMASPTLTSQQQAAAAVLAASLATSAAQHDNQSGMCSHSASGGIVSRHGGGSFSEAVVAATAAAAAAAAAQQQQQQQHQTPNMINQLNLASGGRATSMNHMLTHNLSARSSSASSAHLHAAAISLLNQQQREQQQQQQKQQILSLRSAELFAHAAAVGSHNSIMSRRHTAVSVCPAAAAAAAAAAHHLMSRRGTYVANPVFNAAPLINSGLNLNQHRHSAHTLGGLSSLALASPLTKSALLKPPPLKQMIGQQQQHRQQQQHQQQHNNHQQQQQHLERQETIERQSSNESASLHHQCSRMLRSSAGSQHQLLSLIYPFKRQSSGGAQSACNFSLDRTSSSTMTGSRRSIH